MTGSEQEKTEVSAGQVHKKRGEMFDLARLFHDEGYCKDNDLETLKKFIYWAYEIEDDCP